MKKITVVILCVLVMVSFRIDCFAFDAGEYYLSQYEASGASELSEYLDENSRIIDFEAYAAHIDAVLTKYGYTKSPANSDISGGESGQSTLWLTYTKGDIMVVIENIHTKWFYVDFYKLGDWTLNR
jgi:hypothetical protein